MAYSQTPLRLKNLREATPVVAPLAGRGHHVIQFEEAPSEEVVSALRERGIRVLSDIPGNGLLISVDDSAEFRPVEVRDLGVRTADVLRPSDKLSPMLAGHEFLLAEVHPDVDPGPVRAALLNLGLELYESPDLRSNHLMFRSPEAPRVLRRLAARDEIAYIFPASEELVRGSYVIACAGALTTNGTAGQLISTYGDGWDGAGRNPTSLTYVFSRLSAKLPAATAQSEILRAMNEWSKLISLTWNPGTVATARRTVNVIFGAGAHGDSYPFDGPGRVLGHTFYPSLPNPEPIAGDMHLDDDELWRVGANIDLYSVALHELGHALGLGHSDSPSDVMYPYYRIVSTLAAGDKAAILTLYAAAGSAPPPAPTPTPTALALAVTAPPASTLVSSMSLAGTVSGGTVAPSVRWTSSTGASGLAQVSGQSWAIGNIPLAMGANSINVSAASGTEQASQTVAVTRLQAPDTTAPTLSLRSPSTTSVSTTASSIQFAGTASDNVGVTRVTWSTSTGATGTATGTNSWAATIPLLVGRSTVIIRAYDAAGNYSWRSVVVTRR